MKVLVIPDIHLKPWIFTRADELMKELKPDKAVCLMDIADDWFKQAQVELYEETYWAAIDFSRQYPETLWCWGNHDYSYKLKRWETGYSKKAENAVRIMLSRFEGHVPSDQLKIVHRIDDVVFCHGGISKPFVQVFASKHEKYDNIPLILNSLNRLSDEMLWSESSPLWYRPQYADKYNPPYKKLRLLQVVGHTPVKKITRQAGVLSCDTFSTYRDGTPIGTQEYVLIDTETKEWKGVK